MGQPAIVVIEDEPDIRKVLALNLEAEGYTVHCYADGLVGLAKVKAVQPDLVLVDIMIPGLDGLEICRTLKADLRTAHIPLILVTAKSRESDIVLGLGLGADDYITKPFGIGELLARVKTALRRSRTASRIESRILRHGPLELDLTQHQVRLEQRLLTLTTTEFRILQCLLSSPGQVFSRVQLIDAAIGEDVFIEERTVDTHVGAIRRKLGQHRALIQTVWNVGYRLLVEESDP